MQQWCSFFQFLVVANPRYLLEAYLLIFIIIISSSAAIIIYELLSSVELDL